MTSVLDGVRVLDLSWGVAGPVAGMLLADHGADVVKVEPPGGDPFRGTPGYDAWLRGRRSVELDLRGAGRPRGLPRARSTTPTWCSRASRRAPRNGSGSTRRHCSPTTRGSCYCSITPYGAHPAHQSRPGYDALVAARLGIMHEQRGHFGGSIPHMNGDEPYLPDLEIPEGMAPGSPRSGPIFTYTPWLEHGHGVPRDDGDQRRAVRARAHRSWAARRDVAAPGRAGDDGGEVAARRAQRRARLPHVDHRPARDRRASSAAPTIAGSNSGCRTRGSCSRAPTATRWRCGATSTACATTPTACLPTPRTSIVLAHYFPEMAEAFATLPERRVGAGRRRGRRPAPTGAHAGGGARRPRAASPRTRSPTSNTPSTERCARSGIVYGLSRTPGRVQGPVPARRRALRRRARRSRGRSRARR